jgi:uncharacterized protein (DUF433 family)
MAACNAGETMTDWSECSDVERNLDLVSGAWVVRGTRIPANAVIDNVEDGYTAEAIVADIFPTDPRRGQAGDRVCSAVAV